MSDLKPKGTLIKLGQNEYGMRFTLNAIDDIQDMFGVGIAELPDLLNDKKTQIKNILKLITILINEDVDCRNDETGDKTPHVEPRFVGRHISAVNIGDLKDKIFASLLNNMPEGDPDSPNAVSE